MATKYFQNENPIGQKLEINLWGTDQIFEVEGVVQSPGKFPIYNLNVYCLCL